MHNSLKIKILHVTQVGGGIETYLEQIFNNINRDKFELYFAAPLERTSLVKMAAKYNVPYYPINLKWHISPADDLASIRAFVKIVKEIMPDIVHAHSSKAGMIARLASPFYKSTVVYTPNAFAYLGNTGYKRKLLLFIEKMAIPFTDILLASSQSEAKRSLNEISFPVRKVKIYPNSIEILPIEGSSLLSNSKKIVTTVGRLVNQKNPFMFLKVCKIITDSRDDITFQIIGSGFEDTLRHEIEKFINVNNLKEKIALVEWMDRSALLDTIKNTDVFVMTSAFESFGYVAAEAQMLQIPVVATNVDGLSEIVEDNVTGYLVDPGNAMSMAEKILTVINNPSLSEEMGRKGRERVSKLFNIKTNIKILEDFYLKHSLKNKK